MRWVKGVIDVRKAVRILIACLCCHVRPRLGIVSVVSDLSVSSIAIFASCGIISFDGA
jgi:hypothetical protein